MDRLGGTDGRQVAVALVCEDHLLGVQTLHGGSHCECAAVCCLYPVDVDVVVGEYRATYGRDADRLVAHAQLVDYFGNELVDRTVTTAGAVVHDVVGDELRFFVNQILFLDFNLCHSLIYY